MTDTNQKPFRVLLTIDVTPKKDYLEFTERYRAAGLLDDYGLTQVTLPVYEFRDDFLEYISAHGLSSLFSMTAAMEDITSPSMSLNRVEAIVMKFVQTLLPAKRLVVIDPYFYKPNKSEDTDAYLGRILGTQAATLQQVYVISNGQGNMQAKMHAAFQAVAPGVSVSDITTDEFHDRFWMNPDAGTGIVIGTSLNGLGRKVALVDKLSGDDVKNILIEARRYIPGI